MLQGKISVEMAGYPKGGQGERLAWHPIRGGVSALFTVTTPPY